MNKPINAVLVRLGIRIVPNSRQDPEITEAVLLERALGKGAGKWVKYLLPESSFHRIREAGGEFRRRHYDLTLPWEDGYRLLPSAAHVAYETEFKDAQQNFHAVLDEFGHRYSSRFTVSIESEEAKEFKSLVKSLRDKKSKQLAKIIAAKPVGSTHRELPSLVDQARLMHNGLFDESKYPEWRFMKQRFGFEMEFSPVPRAAHFIAQGFASDAVKAMRTDLERHNEVRVKAAVKDTWNRLFAPIQKIAEKLSDKESIFRDSLIENVKEIVALIPSLNLTNDTELVRVAKTIEDKFSTLDAETLRSNVDVRREVSKAAKQLVSTFGKLGKRRFA